MDTPETLTAQTLLHAFARFRRLNWRPSPMVGLTHSEIMVLSCIKRAVALDEAGIRVSEISTLLQVAAPTITQQLNELETRGFVEKHSDPADRRAVRIRLTAKGDAAITMAWATFSASFQGLVLYLGEEDSDALVALLGKAFTYFQEMSEAHLLDSKD